MYTAIQHGIRTWSSSSVSNTACERSSACMPGSLEGDKSTFCVCSTIGPQTPVEPVALFLCFSVNWKALQFPFIKSQIFCVCGALGGRMRISGVVWESCAPPRTKIQIDRCTRVPELVGTRRARNASNSLRSSWEWIFLRTRSCNS